MTGKMKCYAVAKDNISMQWMEKDIPQIGDYDALLTPVMLSPCTSDVHAMGNGKMPEGRILGHETIAKIVEIGDKVADFKVGEIVAVPAVTPNYRSLDAQDNIAQHTDGALHGMVLSTFEDGTFSEYFKVRDVDLNVARIPETITYDQALMCVDMATTGISGAEAANIKIGDSVAVIGIGPVGLMAVAASSIMGAGRIIGVGGRELTKEMATFYGANAVVGYKGDMVADVIAANGGKLLDSVIVCGGYSDNLAKGLEMVKPNGIVVNLVGQNKMLEIAPKQSTIWCAHKTLTGGLCPGGRRRIERIFSLIENGRLDPGKLVTHRFEGFDSLEKAYNMMIEPKPDEIIKAVVYL